MPVSSLYGSSFTILGYGSLLVTSQQFVGKRLSDVYPSLAGKCDLSSECAADEQEIARLYRDYYRKESFIRVLPAGCFPQTKEVRGSNDCAIGFRYDSSVKRLVVITAIDNLVKGAADQAVQNMNLMCGWPETEGLRGMALVP